MLNLIIFIFVVYGISNMLVYAAGPFNIFEKYRDFMHTMPSNLGEGSECMICTPTQVGIVLSVIDVLLWQFNFTPGNLLIGEYAEFWLLAIALDGALASGTTWLIHTVQEAVESITNKNTQEEEDGEPRSLLRD